VLNNFRCAQGADYRHDSRTGCMKGTRGAILDEIGLWAKDINKPPVYWLNGPAGTGKSAIAQTTAERMFAGGWLGASFFCSRDSEDRSDLKLIFPTLAVQLAYKYPEIRSTLVPFVRSNPGIACQSLYNQMENLVVRPLRESAISTVIVIDALDECKGHEPASAILSILGRFVSQIPKVKFFLTGRPERRIHEGFRLPLMAGVMDVFVPHEVEPSRVDSDIRLFFRHKFLELADRLGGLDDWPTKEHLGLLCERAGGLFAHAATAVKFIDHRNDPRERLDRILQSPETSAHEGKTTFKENTILDSLYMSILQEGFGNSGSENDSKVRSVLGAVVLTMNPLSPSAIAALLEFDTEDVPTLLSSVHSLLILREDANRPVLPFHKSFPDFIVDPTRCTKQRFCVSAPDHHSELLIGCLGLMNRRLEKNMCGLPDGVVNSEVNDLREKTERCIDHGLRYACESWYKHLVGKHTVRTPEIIFALRRFLEDKFLFWLEVLSVLGGVRGAIRALGATKTWLREVRSVSSRNIPSVFIQVRLIHRILLPSLRTFSFSGPRSSM